MNTSTLSIKHTDKLSLIGNMATMLSAGIPILEVVDSLLEDAKGNQKRILQALREDLMEGKHLHITFAKFPRVFDKVTVSVVRAAEEAGTLDVTLRDLKQTLQKEIEFMDKVKAALIYPVFIIVVFFLVLLLILIVVVPKIAQVFLRLRVELPITTRILIGSSQIVTQQPFAVLGVIVTLVGGGVFLVRTKRHVLTEFFFSLPLVSELVAAIDITRFSRSLHLLLSSGIPISQALELAGEVVAMKKTARVIAHSREMVLSGKTLSEGFRDAKGHIPAIMIKLMEAGEKTGGLDRSMQEVADYFDYRVTSTFKTLTALLEPTLLVVVGVVVGGMMLSIISPIYSMVGQVGAR